MAALSDLSPGRHAQVSAMAAALLGLAAVAGAAGGASASASAGTDAGDGRPVRRASGPRRTLTRWLARAFDGCFHALVRALLAVTR